MSPHLVLAETHDGETYAFVLPHVPADAPASVREGIARRHITAITGKCPCGAGLLLPNRAERRAAKRAGSTVQLAVAHEDSCPAVDSTLLAAIEEWRR